MPDVITETGEYQTEDGCEAYVNEIFGDYAYGRIKVSSGSRWRAADWRCKDGAWMNCFSDTNHSIKPRKITRWIGVSSKYGFATKEEAQENIHSAEAIIPITFTPGEGLDNG